VQGTVEGPLPVSPPYRHLHIHVHESVTEVQNMTAIAGYKGYCGEQGHIAVNKGKSRGTRVYRGEQGAFARNKGLSRRTRGNHGQQEPIAGNKRQSR